MSYFVPLQTMLYFFQKISGFTIYHSLKFYRSFLRTINCRATKKYKSVHDQTHICLSCSRDVSCLWFWASWSLSCARRLFLIPRHRDSNSIATPEPISTKATEDALFRFSSLTPPSPEPELLLLKATSEGTTLHTIITTLRAMRPTPKAHSAYWDPEFPMFSLLLWWWLLLLLLLLLPLLPLVSPLPRVCGCPSTLERIFLVSNF